MKIKQGQSLADKYPQIKKIWHSDNEKGPEEYTHGSGQKIELKCDEFRSPDTITYIALQFRFKTGAASILFWFLFVIRVPNIFNLREFNS